MEFTPIDMTGIAMHEGLACDHCGGEAIAPDENGHFIEGDADQCAECGFPGSVTVEADGDEPSDAYWKISELPGATCDRDDCAECGIYAGEHFGPRR